MLASGWVQFLIYVVLLLAITKPLGIFLCRVLDPAGKTFLDPVLKPVERLLYKLLRVNPLREHNWKQYAIAMLVFSGVSMLFTYAILRTQQYLPLNYGLTGTSPLRDANAFPPMIPHLAFNTAASFTTNTNWQSYGGESTLGYFAQMVGLVIHNFFSAAIGIAIAAVLVRGIARDKSKTVGNFWADLVRIHLYLLLPICIVYATFLVSQGMTQNFKPYTAATYVDQPAAAAATPATQPTSQPATTQPVAALAEVNGPSAATFLSAGDIPTGPSAALAQATQAATSTEPATTQPAATQPAATQAAATPPVTTQLIPGGPVASQIAIKMLGTNGGGFFNANAAYPFENPTPLSNLIQMLSIFAIPSALTWYLGHSVKNQKHGWAVWMAMFLVFASFAIFCWWAEAKGNPRVTQLGVACADGTNGNMEGKETRFGIFSSALFATITTDASCGAVNSMHDSFTPLGGMVPLINIQLGEVIFGGVGAGLYGMLVFVVIAIFIAGLMVGRTPEYLGKKIESYDVKVASLAILILTFSILCFAAYASASASSSSNSWAKQGLNNGGPHGFSEILYAYSSCTGNNGSAFAGLTANPTSGDFNGDPKYDISLAMAMLCGRFIMIIPIIAMAGSLARKKLIPVSAGSFPVASPTFVLLLIGTVFLVGALTFVPALCLGPVVEHFIMNALNHPLY